MAYHRKTRRGSKGRNRGSKRLSPHMVRAIKAIALGDIETKRYEVYNTLAAYLSGASYVAPSSFAIIRQNFIAPLPRTTNVSVPAGEAFVGDTVDIKGFQWKFDCYPSTASANPNTIFRFTIYSDQEYFAGVTGPGATDRMFDQDVNTDAAVSRWNPQTTTVLYRRSFTLKQSSTDPQHIRRTFYHRFGIKATSQSDESVAVNTYMGKLKRRQYYWVLEINGVNIPNLATQLNGNISTILYFKDP